MDIVRTEGVEPELSASFGKYRLIARLGAGGMAIVYLAVMRGHGGFNKLVVLKIPRPEVMENPSVLAMFLDEARIAARLSHPNVVQTFEVIHEEGREIIVMEYLDGYTLNELLSRSRKHGSPLPRSLHLRALSESLKGLHYAHEGKDFDGTPLDLVHRDFSPHNIFVTFDGQVKVLDFGVAKAGTQSNKTEFGTFKGKVRYMPAEQLSGHSVDRRADIFAIGAIVWEACIGERLWRKHSDVEVMSAVLSGKIPMPKEVNPDVPDALDAICRKAMAFRPEDRYANCLEIQADIERFLADEKPEPTIRGVVAQLESMFAQPRAARRKIIEEQLKIATAVTTGSHPTSVVSAVRPTLPSLNSTTGVTHAGGSGATSVSDATSPSSVGNAALASTASASAAGSASGASPERKRSRAALVLLLLLVAGGAAFAISYLGRAGDGTSPGNPSLTATDRPRSTAFVEPPIASALVPSSASAEPASPPNTSPANGASASAAPAASSAAAPPSVVGATHAGPRWTPPVHVTSAPPAVPSAPVTGGVSGPAPSTTAPAAAKDCASPFYVDARGVRRLRAECM